MSRASKSWDESPKVHESAIRRMTGAARRVTDWVAGRGAAPVWEGIYENARSVPREGSEFGSPSWIEPLHSEARRMVSLARSGGPLPTPPPDVTALIGIIAALRSDRATVLDFGGGLGSVYLWARQRIVAGLAWTVVETPGVVKAGRAVHAADESIAFVESITHARGPFDLIHVRSAVQYSDDWETTLRLLAGAHAELIALHKLSAGPIPTFATAQLNVSGTRIPYWFLNEDDVLRTLQSGGYHLVSRSRGEACPPMREFPSTHRLAATVDLVFRRHSA